MCLMQGFSFLEIVYIFRFYDIQVNNGIFLNYSSKLINLRVPSFVLLITFNLFMII